MLDLAVSSWLGDRGPIYMDVMMVAEVQELLACELHAVLSDDDIGHPKSMDNIGEE